MCCLCCRSICCRIINAGIVFLVFAVVGLAALDFGMLFHRWQREADAIAAVKLPLGVVVTYSDHKLHPFAIKDWFTEVRVGVQLNGIIGAPILAGINCQFSQPGDGFLFLKQDLSLKNEIVTHSGSIYAKLCYTNGTKLNSKLVYAGYVLCAICFAIAVIVPILVLALCRK